MLDLAESISGLHRFAPPTLVTEPIASHRISFNLVGGDRAIRRVQSPRVIDRSRLKKRNGRVDNSDRNYRCLRGRLAGPVGLSPLHETDEYYTDEHETHEHETHEYETDEYETNQCQERNRYA